MSQTHKNILRIEETLAACALGKPLIFLDEADSTNNILKSRANAGAPEGCTVIADLQTKGRGRMGRSWLSLAGKGLYMSILLRPNWPISDVSLISMFSALATANALNLSGVANLSLKWPNDVLAGHKKIAGILVEPETSGGIIRYCVVGIGINISYSAEDLEPIGENSATSCRLNGSDIERDSLLIFILQQMDRHYQRVNHDKGDWITAEWAKWSRPEKSIIVQPFSGRIA